MIFFFQIRKTEEVIMRLERRVEDLEYDLDTKTFPDDKQEQIENELVEIRQLLDTNKEIISKLHRHNMKSFSFAFILICGCFALYVIYVLIFGLGY